MKMQKSLSLDIETCSPLNLTKVGVFRYAEHPETRVVCMSFKLDGRPIKNWSALGGGPLPQAVINHAASGGKCHAYNAGFEMTVLSGHAGKTIGWPRTKISQWRDTAAKVTSHGLPRSLANAAITLGLPQKDEAGRKVMLKLSKPAGLAKATPEELETLYRYCDNDVLVECSIDEVLPELMESEQCLWELDYKINRRGIGVDLDLVGKVQTLIAKYVGAKITRCVELTGVRPSQRQAILDWCLTQRYDLDSYTADDIAKALKGKLPKKVREVLEIRQATAFAAVKKYSAFETSTCADGRLRGMFLFHGAATGRWTGRGAQLHNLSRPVLLKTPEQLTEAIKRIQDGLYPVDDDKYILTAFKDLVRSMLVAPPGHVFEVSDFSSIEARVLGWMARDPVYQKAFAEDLDLYKVTASFIYGIPMDQLDDDQRWLGKTCVLGLGYAMGLPKFIETVAKSGRIVPDELLAKAHTTYRSTYKPIVKLWSDFGTASIKAVQTRTVQVVGRCSLGVEKRGDLEFLYIQLPSGRRLAYFMPAVEPVKTPWGEMRMAFTALVLNEKTKQLERNPVHGGLLAQHATQAIARDLLANGLMNSKDLPVVGHVHDETLSELKDGDESQLPQRMTALPKWAKELNVKAHGFQDRRYRKG